MNKIIHRNGTTEGPCMVCGNATNHIHAEKKSPGIICRICKECCKGEIEFKIKIKTYLCPECDRSTTSPSKMPNGFMMCPYPDCQAVFPKELEEIED